MSLDLDRRHKRQVAKSPSFVSSFGCSNPLSKRVFIRSLSSVDLRDFRSN